MKTLQDCVAVYEEQQAERKIEADQEEIRKRTEQGEQTLEALLKLGLQPQKVEGTRAVFELDGKAIIFHIVKWKYGQFGFYRLLDEVCPSCELHFATDEMELRLENIGFAIRDPQKRYHDCPNWMSTTTTLEHVEKSAREKLLDALDAYLETRQLTAES